MRSSEERYEAVVPDTLDLAERARLAVNALTRTTDPQHRHEPYHCANLNVKPAYMNHMWGGPCTPKVLEALIMMRVMSGSEQNVDVEQELWEAEISNVEDGLWWLKTQDRPWHASVFRDDLVSVTMHCRLMMVLIWRYRLGHDGRWLELLQQMADALVRIAPHKDDYAYYPDDICYRDGWRLGPDGIGTSPFRGQRFMGQGNAVRALSHWYALSGDERALDLAGKLVKRLLWPDRWVPSGEPKMVVSAEHAHWSGHFHSNAPVPHGVIEYATVANETRLKQWGREFYEYTRSFGLARIGFFPAIVGDHGGRGPGIGQGSCSCETSDMVCLATALSDAGVGDYWEDVDQYARNHLVEHQLLRKDLLEEISRAGPEHQADPVMMTDNDVIDRNVGSFSSAVEPLQMYPLWTL